MKKILLLLLAFVPIVSFAQTYNMIGVNKNGMYEITTDVIALKQSLETRLEMQKITANLTNFEIVEGIVQNSTKKYLMLVASNDERNVKIAFELLGTKTLKAETGADGSYQKTNTCTGCVSGGDPGMAFRDGMNEWICHPCTSGGPVVKSTSVVK